MVPKTKKSHFLKNRKRLQENKKFKQNHTVAIGIDLIDHILQFGLGGVLAEGAHDGTQLLGGDGAIAILIEEGEGLLEPRYEKENIKSL